MKIKVFRSTISSFSKSKIRFSPIDFSCNLMTMKVPFQLREWRNAIPTFFVLMEKQLLSVFNNWKSAKWSPGLERAGGCFFISKIMGFLV